MSDRDLTSLSAEEKRALLARMLQRKQNRPARSFPLSFAQERLWFVDHLRPGTSLYSVPVAIRLRGVLDVDRLAACLEALVERHESLRTRFVTREGFPTQVIDPPASMPLAIEDIGADEDRLQGKLNELVAQPFNLAQGPLLHRRLFRLTSDEHVLALVFHHIAVDYWSLQTIIRELIALYGGDEEPAAQNLPPLSIQYADYAAWQRQHETDYEEKLSFWKTELADAPQLLQLPTDRTRPAVQSFDGARHAFSLSAEISAAIDRTAREHAVTPFMVLLAAFQYLLHRYSGSDDICVGSTVSNRERPELRDLVGLFVNNIVLRTRIADDDTFETLLRRVRATALNAFAHQDVPFERVVDALGVERSLGHNAVFQAMLVLHNTERRQFSVPGMELSQIDCSNRAARFDLGLDMYEGDAYRGVLEYRTDLFDPATIARLSDHFATLLGAAVAAPTKLLHAIDLLGPREHERRVALNDTTVPFPGEDVATLFEASVRERGSAEAVRCGDRALSYDELNAAANRLAARIRAALASHREQPRIAICLPRSEELVVAILAILKIGAAYIPLDPAHPADRLRQSLEDGEASLLLHGELSAGIAAIAGQPPCPMLGLEPAAPTAENDAENPARRVSPADLAYVIFTSGSTGRPKGVPIRQDSLVNLLNSMAREPGMTADDIFVAVTTPAFDIATLELLLPLIVGGRLVVAEAHAVYDDVELTRLLEDSTATMMQATPATWRLLTDAGWHAPAGFKILCGGEALDPSLAKRLLAGQGELWNLYGPTETTIWSACLRITNRHVEGPIIPIGPPIANTQLHVLDSHLKPVPAGVAGELYIGGVGLSPGYFNRPDLTAEKFVGNPFHAGDPSTNSHRLYKTGDQVRQLDDGSMLYLGRLDFQVKLRGFRIELGEIEAALSDAPGIEQAVVALWPELNRGGELVAYCRTTADAPADFGVYLRGFLAGRLPAYMMPSTFVRLDAFPLNTNGKVDRKRLPQPKNAPRVENHHAPRTPTETLVAELWGEILNAQRVGREGHFFELGGHSLLAARMMARLRPIFETVPPLRTLFEMPRLKDFAEAIDQGLKLQPLQTSSIERVPRDKPLPLSFAQQRQWALAQLEEESAAYHMPAAVRLGGPLDIARLEQAFMLLCDRQEVLRSRFPTADGRPFVDIAPKLEFRLTPRTVAAEALESAMMEEARQPFDLAEGPLLRVCLFETGEERNTLLLVLHHIVADALSVDVLVRELTQLYADLGRAETPRLMALPVQYVDFAAWQREQEMGTQLAYWREALKGAPALLELPTDLPRPPVQAYAGDSVRFSIGAPLAAELRALGVKSGATSFMTVLSAFASLLGRYSGMNDVLIGTPVAQRSHPALEGLIGMFVNTLVLRLECDPDLPFASLLSQARTRVLEAFANQDAPFEKVVDALELQRSLSHNPLFQVMFVWHAEEKHATRPVDLDWERVRLPDRTSRVDLSLIVHDGEHGLDCKIEYRTDLFDRKTIVGMAEALTAWLETVAREAGSPLGQFPLPQGRRRLVERQSGHKPSSPIDASGTRSLPQPDIEARIAMVWSSLLRRPDIGRTDNFFSLGGDSILAIQSVSRMRRQGFRISPRDIFQHPTIAALAAHVGAVTSTSPKGVASGTMPLSPIQKWFFELELEDPVHWNQAVLLATTQRLDPANVQAALEALSASHPMLRARFRAGTEGPRLHVAKTRDAPCFQVVRNDTAAHEAIRDATASLQAAFDLENGPLWGAVLVEGGEDGQFLALAAHHLIIDGVSWRILAADLELAYRCLSSGAALPPARDDNAFADWVERLARTDFPADEAAYWRAVGNAAVATLPQDHSDGENTVGLSGTIETALGADLTACLLREVPAAYPVRVDDLLLGALLLALREWTGESSFRIDLESHGRADLFDDIDLSETVGWLTSLYPVRLEAAPDADAAQVLLSVKETLRRVPRHGIGYGVARYLHGIDIPAPRSQLRFNYLGQADVVADDTLFRIADQQALASTRGARNARDVEIEVNAIVVDNRLRLRWTFAPTLHRRETIEKLASSFSANLARLVDHCLTDDSAGYTPADFPHMDFGQDELNALLEQL
ncbi:non-ribosomal peptide synthetase [Aquamicrobium sp. LC103]|uniref:non-ribosomal peptide synthetase n=1 Tax=Aquamicrobium sp. LC103 TaxID=1120658 RepID=UPI00063ECD38|nr:non-ribosomal peptide synthetase [Aquamicrobium sp. LC103]TKT78136.1 non-ribosomal peptide synthetase [Aquamicrobium sp. LC103]